MNPPLLTKCCYPTSDLLHTACRLPDDLAYRRKEVWLSATLGGGWLDLYLPGRSARLESIIAFRRIVWPTDCCWEATSGWRYIMRLVESFAVDGNYGVPQFRLNGLSKRLYLCLICLPGLGKLPQSTSVRQKRWVDNRWTALRHRTLANLTD